MSLEDQLKQRILERYRSVRAFTTTIGIPYSTVDSLMKRGIMNAGVETVLKIFDALDLDIESINEGEIRDKVSLPTSYTYNKSASTTGDGFEDRAIQLIQAASHLSAEQQGLLLALLEAAVRTYQQENPQIPASQDHV